MPTRMSTPVKIGAGNRSRASQRTGSKVATPQGSRKSVATKLFAQKQVKLVSITRGHARLLQDLVKRGAGSDASDVIKRSIEACAREEGINF